MSRTIENNLNKFLVTTKGRVFHPEIIFIDLDGTLLDKWNKRISKKNFEAIKKIQKSSNVVVSTGRSYSNKVKKIMNSLNIEYAICQNGAIIVNNDGKILKNIILNKNQVDSIINIVANKRLGFTINSEFIIYTDHWLWSTFTFLWRKKWKKIKKFNFNQKEINKIVIAGLLKKKKVWNLSNYINDKIPNLSVKTSGRDKIVEITREEATKGEAALYISKLLNIDIKNTIHIGDSENDTTTLNLVGALIAMKDSSNKLLELATHIGPKHKNGGVAKIFLGNFIENKNNK